MVSLANYERREHPLKAVFKELGVSPYTLARYVGRSYSTLCGYLGGFVSPPPEIEAKLNALASQLREQGKGEASNGN